MKKTCDNVLDAIGNTPMIKLNKMPLNDDIKCKLFAKCEYANPGGSVKDRIGYNMVRKAINEGKIKPGDYVIENTGGNTGIGIAIACLVYGMKAVITIPCQMSKEKVRIMKSLGAEVVICDSSLPRGDPGK
jgi:cysteine synthase